MLRTPAPFPHAGSAGFLRGNLPDEQHGRRKPGQPFPVDAVRIIRHNLDGTVFLSITGRRAMAEIASGNCTVPAARLFATADLAMFPPARKAKAA